MWQLPCPPRLRFHLPEGCHDLPGYWGEAEIYELARLLSAGCDAVVERIPFDALPDRAQNPDPAPRILIVDPPLQSLSQPTGGPDLCAEPKGAANDQAHVHVHAARCVLQRLPPGAPQSGATLAFVERHLKRPMLRFLRSFLAGPAAPIPPGFGPPLLALVDPAAALTPDPFEVLWLLENTSAQAQQQTRPGAVWDTTVWRQKLRHQAGRLLGQRPNQLADPVAQVALRCVLFAPNPDAPEAPTTPDAGRAAGIADGTQHDEPSQALVIKAAQALAALGLGRSEAGSLALGPLGRAARSVAVCAGLVATLKPACWFQGAQQALWGLLLDYAAALRRTGRVAEAAEQLSQLASLASLEPLNPNRADRADLAALLAPGPAHGAAVRLAQTELLVLQGQLDEALRIRQQEQLPVYEKLGARRDGLFCESRIADLLLARKHGGDLEQARRLLQKAQATATELKLPEAATLADRFKAGEVVSGHGQKTQPHARHGRGAARR